MPDTTLTSAELDELERLAKAATPGKWFPGYWSGVCRKPEHQGNHPGKNGDNPCVYEPELVNCNRGVAAEIGVDVVGSDYDGAVMSDENVDYIATANPATILRLLSLARAGLEAGKAEESMRERAATVADQLRMVATPGENALFGQGMANAADQIATAIRALPPVTATAKWADPAYIERLERGDHLDSGFLDAIRALPLTGVDKT